jgi:hypothetical protein
MFLNLPSTTTTFDFERKLELGQPMTSRKETVSNDMVWLVYLCFDASDIIYAPDLQGLAKGNIPTLPYFHDPA